MAIKISTIIPIYNSQNYLKKCIGSILKQCFEDYEIILVNDGSTDKSLSICQEFAKKDSRVKVINKKNEGRIAARRDGVLAAKGEYVFFMDNDDWLSNDCFQKLYDLITKHHVDVCIANNIRTIDGHGFFKFGYIPYKDTDRIINNNELYDVLLGTEGTGEDRTHLVMWGRLYKKECIIKAIEKDLDNVFPSQFKNMPLEDNMFNVAMIPYINSLYIINDIVYFWRYGGAHNQYNPLIKEGYVYFDYRFNVLKEKYPKGLPQTFSRFQTCFYSELITAYHKKIYSKSEMLQFIKQQLEERPIILWARNQALTNNRKEFKTEYALPVIQNNPEKVYHLLEEMERSKGYMSYYFKLRCTKIVQKLINFFE